MDKQEVILKPIILLFILLSFLILFGCQIGKEKSPSSEELVNSMVDKLNENANFYNKETSLVVKTTDGGISIDLGKNFDDALELICEAYTSNPDVSEEFDADKVRDDLINKTVQTAMDNASQGRDYYLRKLFAWCGKQSYDDVAYIASADDIEKEKEYLKNFGLTNYQIVRTQYYTKYNGSDLCIKFKWQQ